ADVGWPQSSYIKFKSRLRERWPSADEPEVSCTVRSGVLSMRHIEMTLVDPYSFPQQPFVRAVSDLVSRFKVPGKLRERTCKVAIRKSLYGELAEIVVDGVPRVEDLSKNPSLSPALRGWCETIENQKLGWQFKRYARYLREGTLLPLLKPESVS